MGDILGRPVKARDTNGKTHGGEAQIELISEIDFRGLSLEEFVKQEHDEKEKASDVHSYTVRSIEECTFVPAFPGRNTAHAVTDDKEKEKFEDLHKSIAVGIVFGAEEINTNCDRRATKSCSLSRPISLDSKQIWALFPPRSKPCSRGRPP